MKNLIIKIMNFIKAYIKSMRLYYAFVTGIPGWVGLAFYEFTADNFRTVEILPPLEKKVVILTLLFLSWGINQIINDYFGVSEDKINAPKRPMVSGELSPNIALFVSVMILTGSGVLIYFYLEPVALIPFILGIILNIIYEFAKGYGFLGNLVFGLMITMAPVFGFLSAGPVSKPYFTLSRVSILFLFIILNGIMTFYTYFKDYKGDKASGKKTLVVKFGLKRAGVLGIIISWFPFIYFILIYINNLIEARVNEVFIILGLLTTIMHLGTGILFFRRPKGKNVYHSLLLNFRACICGHVPIIALFNRELALILFIVSYIFLGYAFHIYKNKKLKGLI